jgi:hypothetical protein
MLAIAVAFAAVGVYWIAAGFLPGWIVVAVFGGACLLWAADLVRPSTLRLVATGFVVSGPLRRSRRRSWSECSRFVAWGPTSSKRKPWVRYGTDSNDKLLRRAASTLLWGGDEVIPAGFGRLTARQLAQLMNQYRQVVVGRPADQPARPIGDGKPRRPAPRARRRSRLISAVLFVLAQALLGGAYLAYRVDGRAALWVPLAMAGAVCLIAYAWRD